MDRHYRHTAGQHLKQNMRREKQFETTGKCGESRAQACERLIAQQ
jgi:hypothetical protein